MARRTRAWRCVAVVVSFLVLAAAAAPASADGNYGRLQRKLLDGELPRLVIDLARCVDATGRAGPAVIALTGFTTYNLTPQFIATSHTHLFEDASGAMTLQYTRLRVYPDGSAELGLKRLSPGTHEALAPMTVLRCRLDDGSIAVRGEG